jgi:hypothetical protein
MSYLDQTWCNYWETCKTGMSFCKKAKYPETMRKAQELLARKGEDLILSEYTDKPECYIEVRIDA